MLSEEVGMVRLAIADAEGVKRVNGEVDYAHYSKLFREEADAVSEEVEDAPDIMSFGGDYNN